MEGPLTLRRQRRTKMVYLALVVLGLLPFFLHAAPGWQAAGLGLLFPGGGFLAVGGWAASLLPVTLVLFGAALIVWFGAGGLLVPLAVWSLAAIAAGAMANGPIWTGAPCVLGVAILGAAVLAKLKKPKAIEAVVNRRDERNAYLPKALEQQALRVSPVPTAGERELSPEEMGAMRYCLNLALQPLGELKGFDTTDQFQTSALRYQLNSLGYALSVMQCHYTPNFHGYLNTAQRHAIEQNLQRKIWGYWRLENLWGNFSLDFDPAKKDNIMLTGFLGLQVCLYMLASGDMRYAEPGSLTFHWSDSKKFKHDIHSLIASITKNFGEREFCLYPCEPNWIYTPCNFMGMQTLAAYDTLFGTRLVARYLAPFLEKLDAEFTNADGGVLALRSGLTGFSVPFPLGDDALSLFMNAWHPERARRAWALAFHELADVRDGKVTVRVPEKGVDFGNYKPNPLAPLSLTLLAAREFGETELAESIQSVLDEKAHPTFENGGVKYAWSSSMNLSWARGRIHRRDDWSKAIGEGPAACTKEGPVLEDAVYPEVLVAKAFSHGADLDLVLYPGKAPGPQTLGIRRLHPGGRYAVLIQGRETSLVADDKGCASLTVTLDGRTPVLVVPAK